jgi:hypothetical protein
MARGNGAALASHGRENEGLKVDATEQCITSSRTPSLSQRSDRTGDRVEHFIALGDAARQVLERLRQ